MDLGEAPGRNPAGQVALEGLLQSDTVLQTLLRKGHAMANKDKGGSKSSKTAASKSLKEKRQAKKEKAAKSSSSWSPSGNK
jgi:hypothetical protein